MLTSLEEETNEVIAFIGMDFSGSNNDKYRSLFCLASTIVLSRIEPGISPPSSLDVITGSPNLFVAKFLAFILLR